MSATSKKIENQTADQVQLISSIDRPIEEFTFLRRSLLFAELSMVAYMHPDECSRAAAKLGFRSGKFVNSDGAQAYVFTTEHDCVVACRGTEPNEWNDIRADLYAVLALAETVGRVHRGFKQEVDDLWDHLQGLLQDNSLPLWFTGHSLGGAIATISAGRCFLSHIESEPREIYTYGSPRIGNKRYVNHVPVPLFRWVQNNDVVTRVPPSWLGYRHAGQEFYIDHQGSVVQVYGWRRAKDRLKGFFKGLTRWRIDHFSDHLMGGYISAIDRATRQGGDADTMPDGFTVERSNLSQP
ncbi:MAG: lipase family protein [Pirellulaceae bacterium]